MKHPVEIDDVVNQMTDRTRFGHSLFSDGYVCLDMVMGDAGCKYFLALLVDGKRQRYRSW